MNLAELILAEPDLKREAFPTPEWAKADGQVFIQGLDAEQRLQRQLWLEESADNPGKLANLYARVAVWGLVNVDGARIFSDAQSADLGKKNGAVVARAYDRILSLSGLTKEAEEETSKKPEAQPGGSPAS